MPSTFKMADHEISDPIKIANGFCEFFTSLGPNLAAKVLTSTKSFARFLGNEVVNSVFCEGTDHQQIINICKTLRPGTAAGYDDIHMNVVKSTTDLISEPLAKVINLSITTGSVPSELKIARVIPLFKSGD